jgi:hypothetical protein
LLSYVKNPIQADAAFYTEVFASWRCIMAGCRRRKMQRKQNLLLRRRDVLTRFMVDLGIHYMEILGLDKAINFLRRHHVPEPVITRVLSFPEFRRRY